MEVLKALSLGCIHQELGVLNSAPIFSYLTLKKNYTSSTLCVKEREKVCLLRVGLCFACSLVCLLGIPVQQIEQVHVCLVSADRQH